MSFGQQRMDMAFRRGCVYGRWFEAEIIMIKCFLISAVQSVLVLASIIWLVVALFRRSASRKYAIGLIVVETLVLGVLYN